MKVIEHDMATAQEVENEVQLMMSLQHNCTVRAYYFVTYAHGGAVADGSIQPGSSSTSVRMWARRRASIDVRSSLDGRPAYSPSQRRPHSSRLASPDGLSADTDSVTGSSIAGSALTPQSSYQAASPGTTAADSKHVTTAAAEGHTALATGSKDQAAAADIVQQLPPLPPAQQQQQRPLPLQQQQQDMDDLAQQIAAASASSPLIPRITSSSSLQGSDQVEPASPGLGLAGHFSSMTRHSGGSSCGQPSSFRGQQNQRSHDEDSGSRPAELTGYKAESHLGESFNHLFSTRVEARPAAVTHRCCVLLMLGSIMDVRCIQALLRCNELFCSAVAEYDSFVSMLRDAFPSAAGHPGTHHHLQQYNVS